MNTITPSHNSLKIKHLRKTDPFGVAPTQVVENEGLMTSDRLVSRTLFKWRCSGDRLRQQGLILRLY